MHTGKMSHVTLCSAQANEGIYFIRTDAANNRINASVINVADTARGTTLKQGDVAISTIEHCMAALMANGIDNIRIEVDCEELPILDGSAKYWVELITKAGIKELDAEKKFYQIKQPVHYKSEADNVEYWALPSDTFSVSSTIDFNSMIGTQFAELKSLDEFNENFAKCRTFVFLSEIMALVKMNLIKGGDLDNAIVFADKELDDATIDNIAHFFNKDRKEVKAENGVLNTIQLQYHNEPARHKLLDFVGDIALATPNIKGHFIIVRPGHKNNTEFAKIIKTEMETNNSIPVYDPNKEPVFDAVTTAAGCLEMMEGMLSTASFRKDVMERSAKHGFTNATDAADYLVCKGVPFRDAHGIIGQMVLYCIDNGKALDDLTLEEFHRFSDQFDSDIYDAISLKTCVEKRLTKGAPGEKAMEEEIQNSRQWLREAKKDIPVQA